MGYLVGFCLDKFCQRLIKRIRTDKSYPNPVGPTGVSIRPLLSDPPVPPWSKHLCFQPRYSRSVTGVFKVLGRLIGFEKGYHRSQGTSFYSVQSYVHVKSWEMNSVLHITGWLVSISVSVRVSVSPSTDGFPPSISLHLFNCNSNIRWCVLSTRDYRSCYNFYRKRNESNQFETYK